MLTLTAFSHLHLPTVDVLYFQNSIVIGILFLDLIFLLFRLPPFTWGEFNEGRGLFTFLSLTQSPLRPKRLIWFLWAKVILLLQITIGVDLLWVRIFFDKIPISQNWIYKSFIGVPWIYINLYINATPLISNFNSLSFFQALRQITINFIFINTWFTSKTVVNNGLVWAKSWSSWKKHTFYPHLKFWRFLRLTQKYDFNSLYQKYENKFFKR